MAEAVINHQLAGEVHAVSAGVEPRPRVVEGVLDKLRREGIATEGLKPEGVDAYLATDLDLVVTVCDNAKETCPLFPRAVRSIHIGLHDPAEEPAEAFDQLFEDIQNRLIPAIRETLGVRHERAM